MCKISIEQISSLPRQTWSHAFQGVMQSIYLRDPDGNLVELSSYLSNRIEI